MSLTVVALAATFGPFSESLMSRRNTDRFCVNLKLNNLRVEGAQRASTEDNKLVVVVSSVCNFHQLLQVQSDHSGCTLAVVDLKTKVAF